MCAWSARNLKEGAETGNVMDRNGLVVHAQEHLEKIAFSIAFLFLIEEQLQ